MLLRSPWAPTSLSLGDGLDGLSLVCAHGDLSNVNVAVAHGDLGQASKASNLGQVAQFAANGKETKKKSLAEIAMSYGYVYVAQIAMGANQPQPR